MKLYVTLEPQYDGQCDWYQIFTEEPEWNGFHWEMRGGEVTSMCGEIARKLFPKLKKEADEFLVITVKQGSVWGPA